MFRKTLLLIGFLASVASVKSQDLLLTLEVHPHILKIGDRVTFRFIYENLSSKSIGLVPEYRVYEASDVKFEKIGDGEGELIRYLSVGLNLDEFHRGFRVLRSRTKYVRTLTAKVSGSLPKTPPIRLDESKGIYILFDGSAIKLPGVGTYRVTTRHKATDSARALLNENQKAMFWLGETQAKPVIVEVRAR